MELASLEHCNIMRVKHVGLEVSDIGLGGHGL